VTARQRPTDGDRDRNSENHTCVGEAYNHIGIFWMLPQPDPYSGSLSIERVPEPCVQIFVSAIVTVLVISLKAMSRSMDTQAKGCRTETLCASM